MRISVSNIAWEHDQQAYVLPLIKSAGVEGVEIALTKIAPWAELTKARLNEERLTLCNAGLSVSSYQALYFNKPDLQLLADKSAFSKLLNHTIEVARYAEILSKGGIGVFGAPANRIRGSVSNADAFDIGAERFQILAAAIHPYGFRLALEPAPSEYGGDFLEDMSECLKMVECVNHPAFGLHFDTGCLEIRPVSISENLEPYMSTICHVHISRPFLNAIDEKFQPAVHAVLTSLIQKDYKGWFAIEMRAKNRDFSPILKAIKIAKDGLSRSVTLPR